MKLLSALIVAARAEERWGDYYPTYDYQAQTGYNNGYENNGYDGKSQHIDDAVEGHLKRTSTSLEGNGRICWHCSSRNYAECVLETTPATSGDTVRHGAAYCVGEDYFCYISERRIIRHDGNDFNFEKSQPWSTGSETIYAEDNQSASVKDMKIDMGCQQPNACLRQQHQNYQIKLGVSFFTNTPEAAEAVSKTPDLAREGMCRLGLEWFDYARGNGHDHQWNSYQPDGNRFKDQENTHDRRYGYTQNHHHMGKGTESVCHYCCDPYIERAADFYGCNYDAVAASFVFVPGSMATTDKVDGSTGNEAATNTNLFRVRSTNYDSPVWSDVRQYHGPFRNPHSQYPRKTYAGNTGSPYPNST